MYKKILIPTDNSEHAKRAAQHAKWIALSSEADVVVLNVYETSSLNPIRSRELKKDMKNLWKNEAKENLKGVLEIFNGTDLNVKSKIKEGRPADSRVIGRSWSRRAKHVWSANVYSTYNRIPFTSKPDRAANHTVPHRAENTRQGA